MSLSLSECVVKDNCKATNVDHNGAMAPKAKSSNENAKKNSHTQRVSLTELKTMKKYERDSSKFAQKLPHKITMRS